jgi:hypothetical protein
LNRLHAFDEESVEVGLIPRDCRFCGGRADRMTLRLDVVTCGTSDFVGIRTIGALRCCGTVTAVHYPAEQLAVLLDKLNTLASEKP